ncbi:MAG: PilZ domain-containing protein, partial [Acetatifactor sp.]|nr:PilZ domain-containing protein [Acetatifactor sp.]
QSRLIIKPMNADTNGDGEALIDIVDVSKSGIGFHCDKVLSIGEVYESYLTIWTKEVIHAFLQIVRIEMVEGGYNYGASFVGMPELDAYRIEVYQKFNED